MKFAVLGLGSFGEYAARTLFDDGHEVLAVDSQRERAESLKPFVSHAVIANASALESLKALDLKSMDAVVVGLGPDLESSILAVYHLRELGVRTILAKAQSEDHAEILKRVGATEVVYPERDMARRAAHKLSHPLILDSIHLDPEINIQEIRTPKAFAGKSLIQLNLRAKYGILILAVRAARGEKRVFIPAADYTIHEDDVLIILGGEKELERIHSVS